MTDYITECDLCGRWWKSDDDSLLIHFLIAHPETQMAEAICVMRRPIKVPRQDSKWIEAEP